MTLEDWNHLCARIVNSGDRVTTGQTAAVRYFCLVRRSCIPPTGWPEHQHGMRDRHTPWRAWVWPGRILFRARPAHAFAGIDAHGTHGDQGPAFDFSGPEGTYGRRGVMPPLPAWPGSRTRLQRAAWMAGYRHCDGSVLADIEGAPDIASYSVDDSRKRASPVGDSIAAGPSRCSHEALRCEAASDLL